MLIVITNSSNYVIHTRSSAIEEGLRSTLHQSKSCQLVYKCYTKSLQSVNTLKVYKRSLQLLLLDRTSITFY